MDILSLDDWNNFHRENYQSHKDYNSRKRPLNTPYEFVL